jgi:hypothetical protein
VLLVLVGAVADFAEPMKEDGARQAVACFALVELAASVAAQRGVFDPIEREQGTLQPAELAQRCGDAVLPWLGGQLAHDQRCRHRANSDQGGAAQNFRPMSADQADVDAAGDQRFECGIGRRLGEAVEPAIRQIRDARGELKAEQGKEREDVFRIAAVVGVVAHRHLALMVQEAVEDMPGLARRRRNHLGVERRKTVREVRVKFVSRLVAVMSVEASGVAAKAAGPEELPIRRGSKAAAEHGGERLALLMIDEPPQGEGVGFVANMPVGDPGELAEGGDLQASAMRVRPRLRPSARRPAIRIRGSATLSPLRKWVKQSVNTVQRATSEGLRGERELSDDPPEPVSTSRRRVKIAGRGRRLWRELDDFRVQLPQRLWAHEGGAAPALAGISSQPTLQSRE